MARLLRIEYEGAFYHVTARGNVGTAADIANATVFLASDVTSYVTGQIFHVSGGSVM
jgi:3-oxoacyl-[acyl-carrier protein] reductase